MEIEKEFEFKCIEPADHEQVLAHLRDHYYKDEPINKCIGSSDDRMFDALRRTRNIFDRYPKSLYVVPRNNPNQVAGVLLINILDISYASPPWKPKSRITTTYYSCLRQIEETSDIFRRFNITRIPELAILSVDAEFRGKGLALELYKRAINQLYSEDYTLLYSEFSSPFSKRVGGKLGFTEIARIYFKDFKHKDGSLVFGESLPLDLDDIDRYVSLTVLKKENLCTK